MTKQEQIELIKQKCVEANQSIMDLVFGCEIKRKGATKRELFVGDFADTMSIVRIDDNGAYLPFEVPKPPMSQEFEIIGRDIRLADVFNALGNKVYNILDDEPQNYPMTNLDAIVSGYNLLKDNLNDQSDECVEFIYNLLK